MTKRDIIVIQRARRINETNRQQKMYQAWLQAEQLARGLHSMTNIEEMKNMTLGYERSVNKIIPHSKVGKHIRQLYNELCGCEKRMNHVEYTRPTPERESGAVVYRFKCNVDNKLAKAQAIVHRC